MKCTRHFFLTLLLLLIAACSDTTEVNYQNKNKNKEQRRGVSPSEIVIGSHTDLSGPVAIWGVGSINGARMRFEEVNAEGGIHVHLPRAPDLLGGGGTRAHRAGERGRRGL